MSAARRGVYFNEYEPYAAQWIRNLIAAGHLPAGEVDERSIVDVSPDDLVGFSQCHFFAGIGGWSLAARLAGWPDEREIWSGSLPCQPFSVAGAGRGFDDERDLWHHQLRLLRARRPVVFVGEQVAAAIGKHWLDRLFFDLQAEGYAGRGAVIPACAVNAPHRRDRVFVIADTGSGALDHGGGLLADADGLAVGQGHTHARGRENGSGAREVAGLVRAGCGAVADADEPRESEGRAQRSGEFCGAGGDSGACASRNAWSDAAYIIGHDGKARRVKSGIRLLAHGVSARVGKLRAYGNAIVPQVAAEVIGAYLDCRP